MCEAAGHGELSAPQCAAMFKNRLDLAKNSEPVTESFVDAVLTCFKRCYNDPLTKKAILAIDADFPSAKLTMRHGLEISIHAGNMRRSILPLFFPRPNKNTQGPVVLVCRTSRPVTQTRAHTRAHLHTHARPHTHTQTRAHMLCSAVQ